MLLFNCANKYFAINCNPWYKCLLFVTNKNGRGFTENNVICMAARNGAERENGDMNMKAEIVKGETSPAWNDKPCCWWSGQLRSENVFCPHSLSLSPSFFLFYYLFFAYVRFYLKIVCLIHF